MTVMGPKRSIGKLMIEPVYLRALMHPDGNIRYVNYQSEAQMTDYLKTQGYESVVEEIV